MRSSVFAAAVLLPALALAPVARASSNDINFAALIDDDGAAPRPNNAAFKAFARELGLTVTPTSLQPAETTGQSGFELGLDYDFHQMRLGEGYWKLARESSSVPVLMTFGARARKGFVLPIPLTSEVELGAHWLVDSHLMTLSANVRTALAAAAAFSNAITDPVARSSEGTCAEWLTSPSPVKLVSVPEAKFSVYAGASAVKVMRGTEYSDTSNSSVAPDAPGLNARAALITRGLAEMLRLGVALGAKAETFVGLSGLGDLVLTATGDLSRNRRVGLMLAQGLALPEILGALGHVAEGVYSAPTVLARARAAGVDMPITEGMVALLEGRLKVGEAVERLMSRDAKAE